MNVDQILAAFPRTPRWWWATFAWTAGAHTIPQLAEPSRETASRGSAVVRRRSLRGRAERWPTIWRRWGSGASRCSAHWRGWIRLRADKRARAARHFVRIADPRARLPTFTYTKLINGETGHRRSAADRLHPYGRCRLAIEHQVDRERLRGRRPGFRRALVADQAETQPGRSVVTPRFAKHSSEMARAPSGKIVWVDSRVRVGSFPQRNSETERAGGRGACTAVFGRWITSACGAGANPIAVRTPGPEAYWWSSEAARRWFERARGGEAGGHLRRGRQLLGGRCVALAVTGSAWRLRDSVISWHPSRS